MERERGRERERESEGEIGRDGGRMMYFCFCLVGPGEK